MSQPDAPRALPPVPNLMVFAVSGTDRINGRRVQTVIEAPHADAARNVADTKSLDVIELQAMHPLNGAQALKAAQENPADRFNQPPSPLTAPALDFDAGRPRPATPAAPPVIESPEHAETAGPDEPPADPNAGPLRFASPPSSPTERPARQTSGSLVAGLVLALVGGGLYVTLFRGPDSPGLAGLLNRAPQPAAAAGGHAGPDDVPAPIDLPTLIADSGPGHQHPVLPRSARGPGQGTYARLAAARPAPGPATSVARTAPAARPAVALVLSAVSTGGNAHAPTAVINGRVLRPGEEIDGHRLIRVTDDMAVLEHGGRLIGLGLQLGDG